MKRSLGLVILPRCPESQFHYRTEQKDTLFPNVSIDIGDEIIMQDNEGNNIFGGIIFDADKKAALKR